MKEENVGCVVALYEIVIFCCFVLHFMFTIESSVFRVNIMKIVESHFWSKDNFQLNNLMPSFFANCKAVQKYDGWVCTAVLFTPEVH